MSKASTPSLEITFAGIPFTSPLGVGAVGRPFGRDMTAELHADILLKHAEAGASYIEIPTCIYATEETIRKVKEHAKPFKKPESFLRGMEIIKVIAEFLKESVLGSFLIHEFQFTRSQ